jgi:hypothetical protein
MSQENDEKWRQAYLALVEHGDQGPLAELISAVQLPIPPWIREHIGRMLDPRTNPRNADRLVLSRSGRLAQKMQTQQDQIAMALEVLAEQSAGKLLKNAVTDIAEKHGVSESYINHAIDLARNLPPYYKDLAPHLPPVWGRTARKQP